jgi:hypothetical protein
MFKSGPTSVSDIEQSQNSSTLMTERNSEQVYAVILDKRRVIPDMKWQTSRKSAYKIIDHRLRFHKSVQDGFPNNLLHSRGITIWPSTTAFWAGIIKMTSF